MITTHLGPKTMSQAKTNFPMPFTIKMVFISSSNIWSAKETSQEKNFDGIYPYFLKELARVLAKPLELLFRNSLKDEQLPQDQKEATMTALFQK